MAEETHPSPHTRTGSKGRIVAQEHAGTGWAPDHLHWYIVVLDYDGEPAEELDIDAINKTEARKLARTIMEADYEPGGKVGEVILA